MTQILDDARLHNAGILAKTYDISLAAVDHRSPSAEQASTATHSAEESSGPLATAVGVSNDGSQATAGSRDENMPQTEAADNGAKPGDKQQGDSLLV